jgi:GTP pyrophosphokinase
LQRLHLKSEEAAWEALGEGKLSRAAFLDAARAVLGTPPVEDTSALPRPLAPEMPARRITLEGLQAEPARCCNPAPGDAVVGFITRGQGLRLHRADCRNLAHLREEHPERIMEVAWPRLAGVPVRANVEVLGEDRPELLRDVGNVLAQFKARLVSSESQLDRRTGQNRLRLALELPDVESIARLLDKLKAIRHVDEVKRL